MSGKDELSGLNAETKEQLDARVRIWKRVLFGVAACLVGAYVVYFGLILEQKPAADADKWGQFGDFVGGLLNPIVAFAAFFWLTESVKLQKLELAATRAELKVAADAQQQLVENARVTVQISALTALLQETSNEYQQAREIAESIWQNRPSDDEPHKQMDYDASHDSTHQAVNIRIRQAKALLHKYRSWLR
jgi:hypothetical protein